MTKQELIDKHGIEWYEEYKQRMNTYCKDKYKADNKFKDAKLERDRNHYNKIKSEPEFKKYNNERNKRYRSESRWKQKRLVKDGRIDLIQNYNLALADKFNGWIIHHKLGIGSDYMNSKDDLILMNLYYNRPPEELIWLTISDHVTIHNAARRK